MALSKVPSSGSRVRAALSVASVLALVAGAPAGAHPFLDDRLILLDRQIAATPDDARLYLSRGSLLLDEGHAEAALADFDRALARDAGLTVVHLLRAQARLVAGDAPAALTEARRYLELEPRSARGWRVAARAELADGDQDGAIAAFDTFFEVAAEPRPDDYLERATLQRRAARFDDALRGLEAGIERLGALTPLLGAAFEIERERGRIVAALSWADRLVLASSQDERWQLERARLLRSLGRLDEARAALDAAERALAERSEPRRMAPALRQLSAEIERLRTDLAALPGAVGGG
jgi:predicted Zn-dependent protease